MLFIVRAIHQTKKVSVAAGAVQLDQEMAWVLMVGEKIPHSDTHLTSLDIPLDRDARTKTNRHHKIHLSKIDH